jgi:hypothetical protein
MPGSTSWKSRGDSDAPPDAAHPVVPPAGGGDLITLVKSVLSRMDDDEAASFAAQPATLLRRNIRLDRWRKYFPRSTLVTGADLSRRRRSLDGVNGSMMLY